MVGWVNLLAIRAVLVLYFKLLGLNGKAFVTDELKIQKSDRKAFMMMGFLRRVTISNSTGLKTISVWVRLLKNESSSGA